MTLHCIKCGEEATVRVDLSDGDCRTCTSCDPEFTVSDVQAIIGEWQAILPWLKSHPDRVAEAG